MQDCLQWSGWSCHGFNLAFLVFCLRDADVSKAIGRKVQGSDSLDPFNASQGRRPTTVQATSLPPVLHTPISDWSDPRQRSVFSCLNECTERPLHFICSHEFTAASGHQKYICGWTW